MSMMSRGLAVALIVLAPRVVASQQVQADTPKTKALPGAIDLGLSDSTQRRIAQAMAKDLANLRKAEENYYSAHHAYAYSLTELGSFRPTVGNVIGITPTDGGGYHAVATNPALPGAERSEEH